MRTPVFGAIVLGIAVFIPVHDGSAQMPGPQGGRNRGAPAPSSEMRVPAPEAATPDGVARGQLQEFDDDLKLVPAQRAAWSAYSGKVLQLADDVARNRNTLRFPKGPAPEQLEFVAQVVRNRLTAVEDIVDAGKALYAVLTPAQREIADTRLARIAIPLIAPAQSTMMPGSRSRPQSESPPAGTR